MRQFIGNEAMGRKVPWSARMASLFTSIFGVLFDPAIRKRLPSLPIWAFILLLAPVAVDGASHVVSDLAGIEDSFRDSDIWLAALTDEQYPSGGVLCRRCARLINMLMRLMMGMLMRLAVVWLLFPNCWEEYDSIPNHRADRAGGDATVDRMDGDPTPCCRSGSVILSQVASEALQ